MINDENSVLFRSASKLLDDLSFFHTISDFGRQRHIGLGNYGGHYRHIHRGHMQAQP
jgi:hypothetical protein